MKKIMWFVVGGLFLAGTGCGLSGSDWICECDVRFTGGMSATWDAYILNQSKKHAERICQEYEKQYASNEVVESVSCSVRKLK